MQIAHAMEFSLLQAGGCTAPLAAPLAAHEREVAEGFTPSSRQNLCGSKLKNAAA